MCKKHQDRRGFSLLELAISLIVLSLVAAGIMTLLAQEIRSVKRTELKVKLDAIQTSLINYRRSNDRLPCPAPESTVVSDSGFGNESRSGGICTGGDVSGDTMEGVVPVRTLGLPDTYMFDPWGGRFTYLMDTRTGEDAAFTTYEANDTTIGSITVRDGSGASRTTKAVIAIISHGPNGHGAFQLNGARKSSGSINDNELLNCHCTANAADDAFSSIIAQHEEASDYSDIRDNFDDTVIYFVRSQLLSVAEEE